MEDIALEYEISVSKTYDIIRLVEKTLSSCEEFQLPGCFPALGAVKRKLEESAPEIVVIDAAETEMQHLKNGLLNITAKEVINYITTEILNVDFAGGRTHDFKLFKQSNLKLAESTCILEDKGYQGIKRFYANGLHLVKRRKKCLSAMYRKPIIL